MRNHSLYLKDILTAVVAIEEFREDDRTSSAVIRKFEIIGEATKKIPAPLKKKHPEIPWKEMAGMRDKLIHFYFGIDYKLVWQTIKHRIPQIKPLIRGIK